MKHCFILRIDPVHMEEYLRVHEELWPEMAIALRDSGYGNYSVFADRSGLIVAYVETEDFDGMIAAMQATDVNRRFSDLIGHMFLPVDDERPLGTIEPLRLAMDLDRHLERISA